MNKKVLITGSSGYFGKLITDSLINRNIPVVGIDIRESNTIMPANFAFYQCSIADREKLESIFKNECPTHVLHFACSFNTIRQKRMEYKVDVTGSRNILELAEKTPSVKQLVFSSSAAAYGGHRDNAEWLTESDLLRPGDYRYGRNKKAIEAIYHGTPRRNGLNVVTLRFCTVLGPYYNKPRSVVSLLIRFPFLPAFCRYNKLQFIHSDDVVALFGHILEDSSLDGIFNIASDSFVVVNDLVPGKKYVNLPLPAVKGIMWVLWNLKLLNLQPSGINDAAYPIILNPEKLIKKFQYKIKYSSEEAFRETEKVNCIPIVPFF